MSNKKSKRNGFKHRPPRSNSGIWIAIGGVMLIGVAALLIFGSGNGGAVDPSFEPEVSGQPALKANQEKVDLGAVRLGETVTVNFELTNVGDQPLFFTQKPYVTVAEGC